MQKEKDKNIQKQEMEKTFLIKVMFRDLKNTKQTKTIVNKKQRQNYYETAVDDPHQLNLPNLLKPTVRFS